MKLYFPLKYLWIFPHRTGLERAVAKLVAIVFVYETRLCNPLCTSCRYCGSESAPHLLEYFSCVAKAICKLSGFSSPRPTPRPQKRLFTVTHGV